MNTITVKESILQAFYEIVTDLTIEEIEDIKDTLTAQEFKLSDDGQRISIEDVKKELALA